MTGTRFGWRSAPVRALFATALEEGLIRVNPCAGIRLPRPADGEVEQDAEERVKALTEVELKAFLTKAVPAHRLLLTVLAGTGLRLGEATALQWKHVDLGNATSARSSSPYEGVYAPPKSRYGRRDVPLSPGLAQALWEHRKAIVRRG